MMMQPKRMRIALSTGKPLPNGKAALRRRADGALEIRPFAPTQRELTAGAGGGGTRSYFRALYAAWLEACGKAYAKGSGAALADPKGLSLALVKGVIDEVDENSWGDAMLEAIVMPSAIMARLLVATLPERTPLSQQLSEAIGKELTNRAESAALLSGPLCAMLDRGWIPGENVRQTMLGLCRNAYHAPLSERLFTHGRRLWTGSGGRKSQLIQSLMWRDAAHVERFSSDIDRDDVAAILGRAIAESCDVLSYDALLEPEQAMAPRLAAAISALIMVLGRLPQRPERNPVAPFWISPEARPLSDLIGLICDGSAHSRASAFRMAAGLARAEHAGFVATMKPRMQADAEFC